MRLAGFLVLLSMFISGCGIKGPLYLPETTPAESKSQPSGVSAPAPISPQNNK